MRPPAHCADEYLPATRFSRNVRLLAGRLQYMVHGYTPTRLTYCFASWLQVSAIFGVPPREILVSLVQYSMPASTQRRSCTRLQVTGISTTLYATFLQTKFCIGFGTYSRVMHAGNCVSLQGIGLSRPWLLSLLNRLCFSFGNLHQGLHKVPNALWLRKIIERPDIDCKQFAIWSSRHMQSRDSKRLLSREPRRFKNRTHTTTKPRTLWNQMMHVAHCVFMPSNVFYDDSQITLSLKTLIPMCKRVPGTSASFEFFVRCEKCINE